MLGLSHTQPLGNDNQKLLLWRIKRTLRTSRDQRTRSISHWWRVIKSINQSIFIVTYRTQPTYEGLWDTVATKYWYIKVYRNEKMEFTKECSLDMKEWEKRGREEVSKFFFVVFLYMGSECWECSDTFAPDLVTRYQPVVLELIIPVATLAVARRYGVR